MENAARNPFDHSDVFSAQAQGPQPGDERLFVQFYSGVQVDRGATEREGRPIYKTVPFVKILVPGDRTAGIDTMATEEYKARFPKQWQAFQNGLTQTVEGTPLTECAFLARGLVDELAYFKVYTLEHLSDVNDALASKVPGLQELKRKAKAILAKAKDEALTLKVTEENAQLRQRVEGLQAEIKRLSEMFERAMNATGTGFVSTNKEPQHGVRAGGDPIRRQ